MLTDLLLHVARKNGKENILRHLMSLEELPRV